MFRPTEPTALRTARVSRPRRAVAAGGALLGLANSLYIAPRANQAILDMEQSLAASQARRCRKASSLSL